MKLFKQIILGVLLPVLIVYTGVLSWFYFNQEEMIFRPDKLVSSYKFSYSIPFEEIFIPVEDGAKLHGLLFKADSTKGLVFYLHGNRGALDRWGERGELFVDNGFDAFVLDYRGYGKSTGTISNEKQFYDDVTAAYEKISSDYRYMPKVIVGYSLGTAPASFLAQKYQPELLILMAPYFSIPDLSSELYPFLPKSLAKYNFANNEHLPRYSSKIIIFHGDSDHLINVDASKRLSEFFTDDDTLIVLENQGHGGLSHNPIYRQEIKRLLGAF